MDREDAIGIFEQREGEETTRRMLRWNCEASPASSFVTSVEWSGA